MSITKNMCAVLLLTLFIGACQSTSQRQVVMNAERPDTQKKSQKPMTDSEEIAMKYYVNGSLLEMEKKYTDAISEYETALQYVPSQPVILYSLGKGYLQIGKRKQAMETFAKSVKEDPNNEEASIELGRLYLEFGKQKTTDSLVKTMFSKKVRNKEPFRDLVYTLGNTLTGDSLYDNALFLYTKYIEKYGFDDKVLFAKFDAHVKKKDYVGAINVLKMFIENGNENPYIYQMLGESYETIGNADEAERAYKKASQLVPRDLKQRLALLNFYVVSKKWDKFSDEAGLTLKEAATTRQDYLSVMFLFQKKSEKDADYNEAIIYLAKAVIAYQPDEIVAYLMLGESWFKKKRLDSAEVVYKKALEKFPKEIAFFDSYARILAVQKKYKEAIEVVKKSIAVFDKTDKKINLQTYLAFLYYENNMTDESVKLLESIKGKSIESEINMQQYSLLGLAYDRLGDFNKSQNYYRKALEIDPNHPTNLNNLAYLMSQHDINLDESLEMVEKAIKQEPENPSFLDTKGWILYKQGKYAEAKIHIEKSLMYDSESPVIQEHFGDVLLKLGDKKRAEEAWKKAIEKSSDRERIEKKIRDISK